MKLLRYGPKGQEKPGMLDAAGTIRDLSGVILDVNGDALAPGVLAKLAKIEAGISQRTTRRETRTTEAARRRKPESSPMLPALLPMRRSM